MNANMRSLIGLCIWGNCRFGDFPSKSKIVMSSQKLINEGFSFKYSLEDIYDQSVEYFKREGLLQE